MIYLFSYTSLFMLHTFTKLSLPHRFYFQIHPPPHNLAIMYVFLYKWATHHKLLLVELSVFVAWDRDGDGLLVGVVVAGLGWNVVSRIQTIGFLGRYGQHGQDQLPLSSPDQVHHLLVCRSFYIHTITIENKEEEI